MSPTFFTQCLDALQRMGLVGEKKNAMVLDCLAHRGSCRYHLTRL